MATQRNTINCNRRERPVMINDANGVFRQNDVILGAPNYENRKNTIHDNLGKEILKTRLSNNTIFIDTELRNIEYYPEPFKFDVKFGGTMQRTEPVAVNVRGEMFEYTRYIDGDVQIVIPRDFRNVNSIRIDAVIVPNCIHMISREDGAFEPEECKKISHYKYLILRIKELKTFRKYSNNPLINDNSIILTNDSSWGDRNEYWVPLDNTIQSYGSQLLNISRLSFELYDNRGNPLRYTLDGKSFNPVSEYKRTIDQAIQLDMQHRSTEHLLPYLKSLRRLLEYAYPEVHMNIETVEAELNTVPNFSYV